MSESNNQNLNGIENGVAEPPADPFLDLVIDIRSDLRTEIRGNNEVALEDTIRGKYYHIGHREHMFIASLDGKSNIGRVIEQLNDDLGEGVYTVDAAKRIFEWLSTNNLLQNNAPSHPEKLADTARQKSQQKILGLLNPISFKIGLGNPTRLLQNIAPSTNWLFSKLILSLWLALAFISLQQVLLQWDRFSLASIGILSNGRWIWLLVSWLFLKVIHEAAHGLACIKYGGEVREAGVLFLLFTPMAFVDVTSCWRFRSRYQRMIVSAAGMYVELAIAFAAGIVWANVPGGVTADICYNLMIMASISTLLFNANPLMRFDGYYLMADALVIENLYTKSQTWFHNRLRATLLGFPMSPLMDRGWRANFIKCYAVAAATWKILLTVGLLIAASCMFDGSGLLLAIVGGFFWVFLPVKNYCKQTKALFGVYGVNRKHIAISTSIVTGVAGLLIFALASPRIACSPAMVQQRNEQIVRVQAEGFITKILIRDGETVQQNQPLLVLENPELELNATRVSTMIAQSRIESRISEQQGELASAQAERHRLSGLQNELNELNEQLEQLVVRAPTAGVVHRRELHNMIGSFLKRGDVAVSIGSPTSMEIVVAIDQRRVDSIEEILRSPIRIMLPGTKTFTASNIQLEPAATDIPISDAWCSQFGGPLAVKPADEKSQQDAGPKFRLIQPHLTARIELQPEQSSGLCSGQRCKAFLRTKRQSMAAYLYVSTRDWIESKIEMSIQAAS